MGTRKRPHDETNVMVNCSNIEEDASQSVKLNQDSQEDTMDIDNEMAISDDENEAKRISHLEQQPSENEQPVKGEVIEVTAYVEAAQTWLHGLKWKSYPPSLLQQKVFAELDDNYEDADTTQKLTILYSDAEASTSEFSGAIEDSRNTRATSPLLQPNFDHREFIFTMLQKLASTPRLFAGPLTQEAVNSLSTLSTLLIDDALSGDDERIRSALINLFGDLHSADNVLGELIEERKWDAADEIAADCVFTLANRVAQQTDFYSAVPNNADPVFSMILAETDWLLYEMVSYISDEHADMSLYDEHFYGPSVEEKQREKILAREQKKKKEKQQLEAAVPQVTMPVPGEIYPAVIASMVQTEHHFGYHYIAQPTEVAVDPALGAEYWSNYYDCQQQAAFVQAAAYSYSVKQRAQYAMATYAQANSQYSQNQPQQPPQALTAPSVPQQSKTTSSAVLPRHLQFVKAALKTKSAVPESKPSTPPVVKNKPKKPESDYKSKDILDKYDSHHGSKHSSSSSAKPNSSRRDDDSDRQEGPFYCMVTNLRNDTKASDIERAASKIGRIDSVKVLRDKAAQPPENALAAIAFRYVYKTAFDKLLSDGLRYAGKNRPIAKLSADPFASNG